MSDSTKLPNRPILAGWDHAKRVNQSTNPERQIQVSFLYPDSWSEDDFVRWLEQHIAEQPKSSLQNLRDLLTDLKANTEVNSGLPKSVREYAMSVCGRLRIALDIAEQAYREVKRSRLYEIADQTYDENDIDADRHIERVVKALGITVEADIEP